MKIFERRFLALTITALTFLLCQCTFTTTKKKVPSFSIKTDSLTRLINGVTQTEEIDIEGVETTTNGKSHSELTIKLINPKVFPASSSEVYDMGEDVAVLTRQFLSNPNEYNSYKVLFSHRISNDLITKSDYTGQIFKSDSLKNYIIHVTLGEKFDSSTFRAIGKTIYSHDDSAIVTVFSYFNLAPNSPIQLKLFKETDTARLLLKIMDEGQTRTGSNFICINFKVADFYKVPKLNSGTYTVEFLVNNSTAGTKIFQLL